MDEPLTRKLELTDETGDRLTIEYQEGISPTLALHRAGVYGDERREFILSDAEITALIGFLESTR